MPTISALVDLSGRTAIVTGGALGIGAGIAARLAEAGANVVIADIDAAAAEATAKELTGQGHTALAVQTDMADDESIELMVAAAVGRFGGVDILVNNAGVYPSILVTELTGEQFDRVLRVNLHGVFMATKLVARQMIDTGRRGRIVNITSIDALHPSAPGLATYDASKHGVWGFTKNVALELAPHGIVVNAVAPGSIATPGTQQMTATAHPGGVDMAAVSDAMSARIPMGRTGEPDDIGRAVLFLASDLASYITGAQLVVDGGMLLT